VDIRTGSATGTAIDIAVQVGQSFEWCQGAFTWIPQDMNTTFTVDLLNSFSCDSAKVADVRVVWVFIGSGEFDLDFVRAE
jgi:mannan endo-1,4-beta-mannosidase